MLFKEKNFGVVLCYDVRIIMEHSAAARQAHIDKQYRAAKLFLKKYSTNYAFATQFLDHESKRDTSIAYAFFRYVDEIVDNPKDGDKPKEGLDAVNAQWARLREGSLTETQNPLVAMHDLAVRRNIPFAYIDSFIDAMILDTHKKRYATYAELAEYMYGSACCVGLIMVHIFGCTNKDALAYAEKYGEGMQLINFIRDIDEDLVMRDRIYIPQEYLERFKVTEQMLKEKVMNKNIRALVSFLSDIALGVMSEGRKGIALLPAKVRWPVLAAGDIYEYNLTILQKRDFDIFGGRVKIPVWRKLFITIGSLFHIYVQKK